MCNAVVATKQPILESGKPQNLFRNTGWRCTELHDSMTENNYSGMACLCGVLLDMLAIKLNQLSSHEDVVASFIIALFNIVFFLNLFMHIHLKFCFCKLR